jgi:hypothetical protein
VPVFLGGILLLLAAGCRGGPAPPPADLRPDPGYQRVKPPGLGLSVDLPRRWRVARSAPGRATLRQPARPGLVLHLLDLAGREPPGAPADAEPTVLASLAAAGSPLQVVGREDQRTGWLPGRLLHAR